MGTEICAFQEYNETKQKHWGMFEIQSPKT